MNVLAPLRSCGLNKEKREGKMQALAHSSSRASALPAAFAPATRDERDTFDHPDPMRRDPHRSERRRVEQLVTGAVVAGYADCDSAIRWLTKTHSPAI